MKVIKKLYIIAFALPMLSSISTLQADGRLYFKNTGKTDLTVIISHKKKSSIDNLGNGKTHQTRVLIPANNNEFKEIGYSNSLTNVDISSEKFGTKKLKDLLYNNETIDNGSIFEIWVPASGKIQASKN